MNHLRIYEEYEYVEAPAKVKPGKDDFDEFPFVLFAIWSPTKGGYLAGIPRLYNPPICNDDNIVLDHEIEHKNIKLFITQDKARKWLDNAIRNPEGGDMETLRRCVVVRLNPNGWHGGSHPDGIRQDGIHPN